MERSTSGICGAKRGVGELADAAAGNVKSLGGSRKGEGFLFCEGM